MFSKMTELMKNKFQKQFPKGTHKIKLSLKITDFKWTDCGSSKEFELIWKRLEQTKKILSGKVTSDETFYEGSEIIIEPEISFQEDGVAEWTSAKLCIVVDDNVIG